MNAENIRQCIKELKAEHFDELRYDHVLHECRVFGKKIKESDDQFSEFSEEYYLVDLVTIRGQRLVCFEMDHGEIFNAYSVDAEAYNKWKASSPIDLQAAELIISNLG